ISRASMDGTSRRSSANAQRMRTGCARASRPGPGQSSATRRNMMSSTRRAMYDTLKNELLELLNGIVDPCSVATAMPAGLVDMGLIRAVEIGPGTTGGLRCSVQLCVTHAFCMMTGVFVHEIEKR